MKKQSSDGNIVLSNKKLKNLVKVLKIGDYIAISIVRNIGSGRYRIKLQGLELVAVFNGVLPSDGMIYAVVQAIRPHVVLKLIANDSNVANRVTNVSNVIEATQGCFSLQPFMSDMLTSFNNRCIVILDNVKGSKELGALDQAVRRMRKSLSAAVPDIAQKLDKGVFSCDAVLGRMHEAFLDIKQELVGLKDDDTLEPTYEVQAQLLDLSKECDDLIVQTILQLNCRQSMAVKDSFQYYQLPFIYKDEIVSAEMYLYNKGGGEYRLEAWFYFSATLLFFNVQLNCERKESVATQVMYSKGTGHFVDEVIEMLKAYFSVSGWSINTEAFLSGSQSKNNRFPQRPQAVNVRSIQHFTLVA